MMTPTYQNGRTPLDPTLILERRERDFWYLHLMLLFLSALGHFGWEDCYLIIYACPIDVPLGCLARFDSYHINCRCYSFAGLGN